MKKDKTPWNILVVEDNPGDFFLVEEFLEEQIAIPQITLAQSFIETQEVIKTAEEPFDVILLDLTLPDSHGEKLIEAVMKLADSTPVIVLTGFTDMSLSAKSLNMGVSDYILKDDLNGQVLYKSILYSKERTQFINKLLLSEKRYRELFHLSPQPMWVYDVESLKFLDVNDAAIEHYKYSFEEFMSMTIRDIRSDDDKKILKKHLEEEVVKSSLSNQGVFRHQKKSGELIHVDVRSTELAFNNKRARLILAIDITERLLYVSAIEDQNKRLKEIAWIQSHMVRAPLARLMSLVQMYDMLIEDGEMSQKDIHAELLKASTELDDVIKDITEKSAQIKLGVV